MTEELLTPAGEELAWHKEPAKPDRKKPNALKKYIRIKDTY